MPFLFSESTTQLIRTAIGVRSFTLAALSTAVAYAGCSLDERALSTNDGVSGSSSGSHTGGRAGTTAGGESGGHSPTAGAGAGGQAGEAGAAGEGEGGAPTFSDGCTDLDRDGISDCTETLLLNSNFAQDVSHWLPETGATLAWDPIDLLGTAGSGSALVTSAVVLDAAGNGLVAASQCIPVHPGKVLDVWANARIDPSSVVGQAAISLWFFANPDCPGEIPSLALDAGNSMTTDKTITLSGSQPVPDFMVSMRVRLSVVKAFRAESFSVRFDNVLVVEH